MAIYEKLLAIQQKLKAPKNQYNKFGNYYYRNCEDILEAVKPLCAEVGVALTITDTVETTGDRFYVKATATLVDIESVERVIVTAYARETETKAGMDAAQITGSCSSYARKYALNGLFCIDDEKDPDTQKPIQGAQAKEDSNAAKVTAKQVADLQAMAKRKGVTVERIIDGYKLKSLQDIAPAQWQEAMNSLRKRADV